LNSIKNILQTPLFKVSWLNAVSVLVKIGSGLVAGKILAVFIGPSGMAIIGNFRNAINTADTFSTLGIQHGIIKYVAEDGKEQEKVYRLLSTVFISIFCFVAVLSGAVFLLAGTLDELIFTREHSYAWVFKVLAFTLPWHAANIIFMAVINGLGKFKQVITVTMAGNIIGLAISTFLIWYINLPGALLGLIISPALLFVFSFYLIHRQFNGFSFLKRKNFDITILKKLLSFSLMSLVNIVLGQIIFISIRNMIIAKAGIEEAGFWEAMNRIAFFYLMFVTTLLTVYFLPKLSAAENNKETRKIFSGYYKGIVPLFIAGCIVVYLLRFFIINVLLTKEFIPMEKLFLWQLLGDIIKVCALILGYQFFARKMTKAFIITEILSFAVLYLSSLYLINLYGSEGAVMAHAVTYVVYFVVLVIWFRKLLFNRS
jgi:O-antigen/teichoic acid export membrane protein